MISMKNATFSVKVEMDTLSGMCGPDGNVLVTNIGLPLAYDDIDFRFTNLGLLIYAHSTLLIDGSLSD